MPEPVYHHSGAEHLYILGQLAADVLPELDPVPEGGLALYPVDRPSVEPDRLGEKAVGRLGVFSPEVLLALVGKLLLFQPFLELRFSPFASLMLDIVALWRVDGIGRGDLDDIPLETGIGDRLRLADVLPELLLGEAVLLE